MIKTAAQHPAASAGGADLGHSLCGAKCGQRLCGAVYLFGGPQLAGLRILIVLVLLRRGKARKADPGVPFWINGRMLLRGGAFCGIALFAASAAQQIGIGTTSTAKAGF